MSRDQNVREVRAIGCSEFERTPTAFQRSAQGCRSRHAAKATLGSRFNNFPNPNGVLINSTMFGSGDMMQPRWGWFDFSGDSQGSACRATLGWMMESRWRSAAPGEILKSLSQLEAEIQQGMKELEGMLK
jgi:hypothetical protein